jgi:succinate dehydrogenase / fumarate reductase membrane anchor subunit
MVMVLNQASLKRDGVQDYVSLRATAIVLALYSVFILGFFLITPEVTFEAWQALFAHTLVKVFTLLALVLTDYIKSAALRAVLQFFLYALAFSYVAVGLFVLWGA